MYNVRRIVYIVYSVHFILYTVHRIMYSECLIVTSLHCLAVCLCMTHHSPGMLRNGVLRNGRSQFQIRNTSLCTPRASYINIYTSDASIT